MAARGTAITASEKKTRPRTAPWTFGSRSLGIRSSMIEERWKEPTIDRFRRVAGYGRRGNRSIGTGVRWNDRLRVAGLGVGTAIDTTGAGYGIKESDRSIDLLGGMVRTNSNYSNQACNGPSPGDYGSHRPNWGRYSNQSQSINACEQSSGTRAREWLR